jgi:hypothetical protein
MPLEKIYMQERITDLLVRFWGLGKELDAEEKDALLTALDAENKSIRGPIHLRALERLRDKGIE